MIHQNISQLIDNKGISLNEFSNKIGVSNGYFSKQKAASGAISNKIIEKIVIAYPDLNLNWLITGKGPMFLGDLQPDIIDKRPIIEIHPSENKPNTLIADVKAAAGMGLLLENYTELEKLPAIHLPNAPFGLNIAFPIQGDSMHPRIRHSDMVVGNKVEDLKNFRDGFVYIIVDKEERVICKRAYRDGLDFRIVSDNKIYSDYQKKGSDILAFFRAWMLISEDFRTYYDDVRSDIDILKSDMLKVKDRLNIVDYMDSYKKNKKELSVRK